ncbi:MAG: DUF2336 domain-containing protein [Rhodospirillales bacterium]|nr:DUF2336 domain-containing protein [Rhodospirillales bacterium]
MWGVFKNLLGGTPPKQQKPDPVRYDREKGIALSPDLKGRMNLAGNSKTHQEILYYLAEHDPDPAVRKAVAANKSTPVQASAILAGDANEDVRLALAGRLVKLLPELSEDTHSQLYAHAVQALGRLALDEVLKIRKALSSTLKDCAHAPPKVAAQLARDIEREVSEPVLRFCTALADEDLLDIIKTHPAAWAVTAIAARKMVSSQVSEAVIESDNRPAGKILIGNKGAQIGPPLLKTIIEKARDYPEWQGGVALRKNLPPELAKELAQFADESVRALLGKRKDFDRETAREIAEVFRRRLEFAGAQAGDAGEDPMARAVALDQEGRLTEEAVSDALALRDRRLVYAMIALRAKVPLEAVEKIFGMKAPKAVVALSWKADLSMRLALQLQKDLAQVSHKELIYPRGGTDYPLSEDELRWQLEFLGL